MRLSEASNEVASKSSNRLLAKQVIQYAPAAVVPAVFGLLTSATFTRVFSADEFGQYSLTVSVTGLLAALLTQWLQQGISRYLPGDHDEREVVILKRAVALALGGVVCVSVIISIVAGATLRQYVASRWQPMMWAAVCLSVVSAVFNPLLSVLQAEMQAAKVARYQSAAATLRFGLSLLLVYTIYRNPASLIWATTCAFAMLLPMMWTDARLPAVRRWTTALPAVRRLANYGLPMMGWFLCATVLDVGDRYVVQFFRGSAEVGIYAANYGLVSGAIGLVTSPIALAAHPFLMRAWSAGNREEAGRWLGVIVTAFATTGVFLVGVIWLFSRDIAQWLLGAQFREGYPMMPVVFAGAVVWQLGMYLHKPLEFTGRTRLMFYLSVACGALNVALNVMLVPTFGYMAAAYSTLASYAAYAIWATAASRGIVPWQTDWPALARTLITITVLALAVPLRLLMAARLGYIAGLTTSMLVALIAAGNVLHQLMALFKGSRTR